MVGDGRKGDNTANTAKPEQVFMHPRRSAEGATRQMRWVIENLCHFIQKVTARRPRGEYLNDEELNFPVDPRTTLVLPSVRLPDRDFFLICVPVAPAKMEHPRRT